MDTIDKIKERVQDMPAISSNTVKILDLIAGEDYTIKDLSDLISLDVSLSTKCIKTVNSASFGLRSEVTSIERAVSYLGKQAIFGMVIEKGFSNVFSHSLEGYNAEEGELWEHSLRVAVSSRLLALAVNEQELADVAYTAGLLHNMGKVIITDFLKNYTTDIKERCSVNDDVDFSRIEEEILETNHSVVGKMMAEKWGIPKSIQTAVLYHHNPEKAPQELKILCYLVHFGDHLAMLSGGSASYDALSYEVDPKTKEYIDLEDEKIEDLLFDIELEIIQAREKIFGKN
ncbi:MAG: HDOD domain-containing protein [bacterium]|nr:HDOD domain-containing protein [bacterium]